jgi:hypothetical protein
MLLRAFSAETLKLKRTLALGLALLAPLLVIGLQCLVALHSSFSLEVGENPWLAFSQGVTILWGLLMLPLFVTLQTALTANLEHGEKTWKQLYAMPVPRWTIYAAKTIINLAIIGLSTAVLGFGQIAAGLILGVIKPSLHFAEWPVDWQPILFQAGAIYLGAWLIIAIHTWISLRWHSFPLASGVGIAATITSFIAINSEWARYFPWTQAVNVVSAEPDIPLALTIGIAGGLAASLLGGWDVTRRDVL